MIPALAVCAPAGTPGLPALPTLESIVGTVPANFNMVVGQNFPGPNPFTGLNDAWALYAGSISSGVSAPDGTTGAQKLIEDTTGGASQDTGLPLGHSMRALFGSHFGISTQAWPYGRWRLAAIVEPAGRTRCVFDFWLYGDAAPKPELSVGFDLAGGHVGYDNVIVNGTNVNVNILSSSMLPIAGAPGWYLCIVDCSFPLIGTTTAVNFGFFSIYLDNGSGTAARSVTYTGNGTSGINIWWASVMPVGGWIFDNLALFDDFTSLSTIDMADTLDPSKTWFLRNQWPQNSSLAVGMNWFNSANIDPVHYGNAHAADMSISGTILTIARDRSGYSECLTTAAAVAPHSYVGKVFAYPALFEAKYQWDNTLFATSGQVLCTNVSFWGSDIGFLTGIIGTTASVTFREDDVMEGTTGSRVGQTMHDWTISSPGTFADNSSSEGTTPTPIPTAQYDFTQFHRYAQMMITAPYNDGNFSLDITFTDGLMMGCAFWGATIRPNNDSGKPIGSIAARDANTIPLMLGCGSVSVDGTFTTATTHIPLHVDWVKAFQTSSPTTAPTLSGPAGSATSATTAMVGVTTNAGGGVLYWVVTLSSTPPNAAQIIAGQDNSGTPATAHGSQAVLRPGVQSATAGGLAASTHYTTHYVQTWIGTSNVATGPGFTTAAPSAPTLSAPTGVSTGSTTASLNVTTNVGNGTLYWVVTLSATPPTAAQIQAGQDNTGAGAIGHANQTVSAAGVQSATATGLSASTTYFAHFNQTSFSTTSNVASTAAFTTAGMIWDPATKGASVTLTGGNLTAAAGVAWDSARSSIARTTGKWYWEITINTTTSSELIGICDSGFQNNNFVGGYANSAGWQAGGSTDRVGWGTGPIAPTGGGYATGDVIGFALDVDAGHCWMHRNGVWQPNDPTGAASVTGIIGPVYVAASPYNANITANFGATAFVYAPPAGFGGGSGGPTTPVLSSPTDVATGVSSASLSVSTNTGSGTLYWVVTLSSIPPTAAQIQAGHDHAGVAASASNSQAVTAAGVQSATAMSLSAATSYTAHFVQVAASGTSNVASGAGFTTAGSAGTIWDAATKAAGITLSSDSLSASAGAMAWAGVRSNAGHSSGKWYWEVTVTSDTAASTFLGICDTGFVNNNNPGAYAKSAGIQAGGGGGQTGWSSGTLSQGAVANGDIIGFALDVDTGTLFMHHNGVWHPNDPTGWDNTHPVTTSCIYGISGTIYATVAPYSATYKANFGATTFAYTVPTGFTAGF